MRVEPQKITDKENVGVRWIERSEAIITQDSKLSKRELVDETYNSHRN